jgi:hypothetical protein
VSIEKQKLGFVESGAATARADESRCRRQPEVVDALICLQNEGRAPLENDVIRSISRAGCRPAGNEGIDRSQSPQDTENPAAHDAKTKTFGMNRCREGALRF